jgi:Tfp pilus assembly protein PilF
MNSHPNRIKISISSTREKTVSETDLGHRPGGGDFRRLLVVGVVLVTAVVCIYAPIVRHDFVKFDDHHYIFESPVRDGLSPAGVVWAFSRFHSGNWHPLTWISHMLDVSTFGFWPGGHHLVSVALHAANAVLLLIALHGFTGRLVESSLVAAVFAVHPLRVESVAWAAERKDVLSGFFMMLTLLFYERYVRGPFSMTRYAAVCAALAAGLLSKPMLVTLPCVLLLIDWWPLHRLAVIPQKCLLEKVPLFAMSMMAATVTVFAQGHAVSSLGRLPMAIRIGNSIRALCWYVAASFWPKDLAVLYPYDRDATMADSTVWLGGALVAFTLAAIALARWIPAVLMGWFWFCGMMVPVLGIIQVGSQPMADRFTYLPGIGLAIAVVFGGAAVYGRLRAYVGSRSERRWFNAVEGGVAAAAIIALSLAARAQLGHWKNTEALWRRAVSVTKRNDRAIDNLAWTLAETGRKGEAARYFAEGLAINPRRPDSANALGLYRLEIGEPAAAADAFRLAIESNPDVPQSHANLGIALARMGEATAARAAFESSVTLDPNFAGGHYNLAQLLISNGDTAAAKRHLAEVLRIDATHGQARAVMRRLETSVGVPSDRRQ